MQLLAYGGTKPLPYQRSISQSQALEPGIVAPVTADKKTLTVPGREAFRNVAAYLNCATNSTTADIDAQAVVDCLRSKDTTTLLNASLATYTGDISHNTGDIWLPSVDGDFLPDAPSKLLSEGRFGNVTYTIGWAEDDTDIFTNLSIATQNDVYDFFHAYLPGLNTTFLSGEVLDAYPESDFHTPAGSPLSPNFYRASRIFRDILMVCEPFYLAEALHRKGNQVYLYNWNQTILPPILKAVFDAPGLGVVHTSEFAYMFGNISVYNVSGVPFDPSQQDYDLVQRGSRTWAALGAKGHVDDKDGGVKGWKPAYSANGAPGSPSVYTIGGSEEGLFPVEGTGSPDAVAKQRLAERCALWNRPEIISQLGY